MIRKDLDQFTIDDKFSRAGRAAEEQMSFYLKRFFGNNTNIHVMNSVRLERDGDAAQIDHLIIHPYGIIIVESKSVLGKIQIKDDGQWIRWYGDNNSKGMASPITQAKLQAAFLKSILGHAAGSESIFDPVPFDTIVAISDTGVILWPKTGHFREVCKADQVAERIEMLVVELAKNRNNAPLLSPEGIEKIVQYLIKAHKPLTKHAANLTVSASVAPTSPPVPPEQSKPAWSCRHCGSGNLEIRYAHNYFFFCHSCEKNMAIKPKACPSCGEQERVRKKANDYFFDCKKCETTKAFFTNVAVG